MTASFFTVAAAAAGLFLAAGCAHVSPPVIYPATARTNQVDQYHGVTVADPYRWLEDDNSPQTKAWVVAQNEVTFGYLRQLPQREPARQRLTQLWNYERQEAPFKRGGRYFFRRNNGLQNQSVLFTQERLGGEDRVLLDPNTLSADGTVALAGYSISDDGRRLAYGLAASGSDWQEWKVREVATGKDLPDLVQWVKFSGAAWSKDGEGFYYSRYDAPEAGARLTKANYYHKLYYHQVGTPQSQDRLIYHRPDQKEWNFQGEVTDDGHYLVIAASQGTSPKRRIFYLDLQRSGAEVVRLLTDFDAAYDFVDNADGVFWFRTDWQAPRGRVIAIDLARPERSQWRELVPQAAETLTGVSSVGGRLVATYLKDAHSQVKFFSRAGTFEQELALPGIGSASGFGGRRDDPETFFTYTSYTTPATVYRLDLTTRQTTLFRAPKVDFNPADYETRQVFYSSRDGTRVPMFITHKKGLALNGNNPLLLYGYGGFNISMTPGFSVANLAWMEQGGVYAVANLRGGGEYGEEWHLAGTRLRKQNVFDDFISAAEWLVRERYTRPSRLAIYGGSNGGLLVGAVVNQRPDLFAAAIPAVGVMDMLRFHKFTIGWAWTSDYGSPENPSEFRALHAYSPLHNLKPGTRYPAVMVTTGDHDDRVVPAHSFKYAAALQAAQTGPRPTLIRIETKAGHGAGKPTATLIEEAADLQAFIIQSLGQNWQSLLR